MRKSSLLLCFILFSMLMGGFAYFLTMNLIYMGAVCCLYLLGFLLLGYPWLNFYNEKEKKRRECYRFLNSFIVSMSLTESLEKSFENASKESEGELLEVLEATANQDVRARIFYLERYFQSEIYAMFLSLYCLYEKQGGDLLLIAKEFLDELTRVEESGNAMQKQGRHVMANYLSLWGLSIAIMAFLRLGLANFYNDSLIGSPLFLTSIAIYFLFLEFGILYFLYVYCHKPPFFAFKREGRA